MDSLILSGNNLSGPIPDVLTEMTALTVFDVERNALSGPAVVDLSGLGIESYRVSANRLTGTIPASVGSVTSLRELWMADNMIVGNIPEDIGNLKRLDTLYLYSNVITGTIPLSMGSLSLSQVQLHQNLLIGNIPESFYNNTAYNLILYLMREQFYWSFIL